MKKITFQIASAALVVVGLIGCSETNTSKKGLWSQEQLTGFTAGCTGLLDGVAAAANISPICACYMEAVTTNYSPEESNQDANDAAIAKKLDECADKNGEPELLIHGSFIKAVLRNVNADQPLPSAVRKALEKARAKHAAKAAPVAPVVPAPEERPPAPHLPESIEAPKPVDALNPENVKHSPADALKPENKPSVETGRPAPQGLDSHTSVAGINGEFGGVCVDNKDGKSSSRTTYAISFDAEKNEGVLTRMYQQYEGIGCDEAKKNGYGDRLLTQKITKLEGSKTIKVVGPAGEEAGTVEGFRFETLRTDEHVNPLDRRFGSEVLRLVQIDGKPHLLTVGQFSNAKNSDQANKANTDIFDDMHFSQVNLSSISALPRIEKKVEEAPVATK